MIAACLVPARMATGFGAFAGSLCALRATVTILATTGSIPMAWSPASVAISVVPWPP